MANPEGVSLVDTLVSSIHNNVAERINLQKALFEVQDADVRTRMQLEALESSLKVWLHLFCSFVGMTLHRETLSCRYVTALYSACSNKGGCDGCTLQSLCPHVTNLCSVLFNLSVICDLDTYPAGCWNLTVGCKISGSRVLLKAGTLECSPESRI